MYEKAAQKFAAPKEGEAKKKTAKGKVFNWCHHHKEWTMHSLAECRLKGDSKAPTPKAKNTKVGKSARKMKVLQTLAEWSFSEDDNNKCFASASSA